MPSFEIIHIVLGKANPERMNGVNRVVYQLATKQAESGRAVSVWGITKDPDHNYGERAFNTVLFQAQKNPFSIDPELKKAIISKKGRAVFHLHGGWIPVFSSLSSLFETEKIPFCITGHGAYNEIAIKRSKWVKKLYFALFEKPLLKRAMRIHCIGDSEVSGTNKLFKNQKSFLLPYGFEFSNPEILENKQKNELFTIGFVGRLDIYTKGLDLLLDAFDAFHKLENKSVLWIVGDSKEKSILEKRIAEKDSKDAVVLWGSKFGAEKDEIMSHMDIFAHPSRNEGLPATILEASIAGLPSVVSEATNMANYISSYKAGIAIPNESVEALADAFKLLYNEWATNGIETYSVNARKMVSEVFNWNIIVEKLDTLYEKP